LAWTNNKNRNDLLLSIQSAFDEGLDPNDYHLEKISELLEKTKYKNLNNKDLVDLDFLMTDALILYASHLISGKVEQAKLRSKWDVALNPRPENIDSLLTVTLHNKKIKEALESLKPRHYLYKLMKFNLKVYRELAKNGGWPKIEEGETLKKDMINERILAIRKYLLITQDLKSNAGANDSLYDEKLEEAVKKFQTRHNLTSDGVIGKGTLEQMNVSVADRVDMFKVNLERMRWVFHEQEDDFLLVNIAGFYVKRFRNKEVVFSSRVIVGKFHKETPIFKGEMQYIVLNPTWTLPYSIATHETLPKLKKDPGYLSAKHMEIMDRSGKILNYNNIDFSKYSTGNFPFIVRQKAGPWNALGQVKFIFPNKYSVYLHDTPSRSLFNRQDRAFSHGCIRMFPEDIEWLFPQVPVNTPVRIVNQPIKLGWSGDDLYLEVHPPLEEGGASEESADGTIVVQNPDEDSAAVDAGSMTDVTEIYIQATRERGAIVDWELVNSVYAQRLGIPVKVGVADERIPMEASSVQADLQPSN